MNTTLIEQPHLRIQLFVHQLISISNMEQLEQNKYIDTINSRTETNIGINADMIGFGKTLSMIGLIVRDRMGWDMSTPFLHENIQSRFNNRIITKTFDKYTKLPCTIVLINSILLSQWTHELTLSSLRVSTISKKNHIATCDITVDVILVTHNVFNTFVKTYKTYAWKRFIYDEPSAFRMTYMAPLVSGFTWLLCSTPNLISSTHRNTKGYMANLVCDLVDFEVLYEPIILKTNDEIVKKSYPLPTIQINFHECRTLLYKITNGIIPSHITDLMLAHNIKGVIDMLECSRSTIVDSIRNKKRTEIEEIDTKISVLPIDNTLIGTLQLQKSHLTIQIQELDNRFNEMLTSTCPICMELINCPVMDTHCQTIFCGVCINKWKAQSLSCPICRLPLEMITIEQPTNIKTKLECIYELLSTIKPTQRFIIFSNFIESFIPIESWCVDNSVPFINFKCTESIQRDIVSFKNGTVQLLLMHSLYKGVGLNLQETTDIVLFHPVSHTTESQVFGRANRIGRHRDNQLVVHRFIEK